ncbi:MULTISPECIES: DUF3870 domain-containing protein [Brevibacterium]|uniref:DUF3870 domain-containing protein n=1 Tax=Brevibacterium salitolerans TaxID=1403566 RepID=A0ABP5IG12_9MICO|nr:DUF3870 domain-containing protein [Brevibacterium sp.]
MNADATDWAGTVYLMGEAKAPSNNPITAQWGQFFIGLVIDTRDHTIRAADCTAALPLTAEFVRRLLVGRSILDDDSLVTSITVRYHGSSQRALAAAVRNAAAKYRDLAADTMT